MTQRIVWVPGPTCTVAVKRIDHVVLQCNGNLICFECWRCDEHCRCEEVEDEPTRSGS
jgi:hypothetical protein